jgi:large subunit ribosomal protein L34
MKGKRTFQPNTRIAPKAHGFLVRMSTKNGRLVLKRRARKVASGDRQQRIAFVAGFAPRERVRRRPEFQQIYERGRRIPAVTAPSSSMPNGLTIGRLGDRRHPEARRGG